MCYLKIRQKIMIIVFLADEYFNSVIVKSKINLTGQIKKVKILEIIKNTLFGELIDYKKREEFAKDKTYVQD